MMFYLNNSLILSFYKIKRSKPQISNKPRRGFSKTLLHGVGFGHLGKVVGMGSTSAHGPFKGK